MTLTPQEISQIATRTADEVMEQVRAPMDIRDLVLGSAMGEGAIPLYGRETRKEPCACCLIDPEGPNAPENRMCTTKGAIGTLSDREEREWCSEINIVADGRCARASSIREAARECKEKHPDDTKAFFECYAPAFSQITKESNPGPSYLRDVVPIKRIGTTLEPGSGEWLKEVAKGKFKVISTHRWQAEAETAYMELKAKGFKPTLYAVTDTWTTYYVTIPKGSNPSLIGPIVAATVTMQKLEEERKRKKAQRGW